MLATFFSSTGCGVGRGGGGVEGLVIMCDKEDLVCDFVVGFILEIWDKGNDQSGTEDALYGYFSEFFGKVCHGDMEFFGRF
jgi:hypothetical protein